MIVHIFAFLVSINTFVISAQQRQCPSGFLPSTVVENKCFHIHSMRSNCTDAKIYCKTVAPETGNLISIGSAFENSDIHAHLSEKIHECGEDYWIGSIEDPENGIYYRLAYKDWILLLHNNWNPTGKYTDYQEMLTTQSKAYHLSMKKSNGRWDRKHCTNRNCFICEAFTSSVEEEVPNTSNTNDTSISPETPSTIDDMTTTRKPTTQRPQQLHVRQSSKQRHGKISSQKRSRHFHNHRQCLEQQQMPYQPQLSNPQQLAYQPQLQYPQQQMPYQLQLSNPQQQLVYQPQLPYQQPQLSNPQPQMPYQPQLMYPQQQMPYQQQLRQYGRYLDQQLKVFAQQLLMQPPQLSYQPQRQQQYRQFIQIPNIQQQYQPVQQYRLQPLFQQPSKYREYGISKQ